MSICSRALYALAQMLANAGKRRNKNYQTEIKEETNLVLSLTMLLLSKIWIDLDQCFPTLTKKQLITTLLTVGEKHIKLVCKTHWNVNSGQFAKVVVNL